MLFIDQVGCMALKNRVYIFLMDMQRTASYVVRFVGYQWPSVCWCCGTGGDLVVFVIAWLDIAASFMKLLCLGLLSPCDSNRVLSLV